MNTKKKFASLFSLNKKLLFQNREKEKRTSELTLANAELLFQHNEKVQLAAELTVANTALLFQNREKAKQALELISANSELKRVKEIQQEYIIGLEKMMHMISHEVRLPVTQLLGLSGLLENAKTSKSLATILDYIRQTVKALDTHTRDFTKFLCNLVYKSRGLK